MELTFNISTQRVLRECISQTSLDLQAIRARGTELSSMADNIYADWVMDEDDLPEIYTPMETSGAKLCQRLRRHIVSYASGVDITTIQLCAETVYNGIDSVIETSILAYYKYSILAWWYSYRDAELSNFYTNSAESVLNDILDSVLPRKSKIVPHYF